MVTCPQGNWNRTSLHVQVRNSSHSMDSQGLTRVKAPPMSSHDSWDSGILSNKIAAYKTKNDVIGGWMEI